MMVLMLLRSVSQGNPYRPHPVLFVHGYRAHFATWGVERIHHVRHRPDGVDEHDRGGRR